ncbi:MAG TPA: hypothetical protein H9685_02330 [Firmicutes bacterium]|nr:hypothetical protein [Bacillota bacterium]
MIKFSDLQPHPSIPEYHVQNADTSILLADIAAELNNSLMKYKLSLKIGYDEIRSRSVFNPTVQKCVTIENVVKNYYKYCITTRNQGSIAFISTYILGRGSVAANTPLFDQTENAAALSGLSGLEREKLKNEREYYSILNNCITSVLAAL